MRRQREPWSRRSWKWPIWPANRLPASGWRTAPGPRPCPLPRSRGGTRIGKRGSIRSMIAKPGASGRPSPQETDPHLSAGIEYGEPRETRGVEVEPVGFRTEGAEDHVRCLQKDIAGPFESEGSVPEHHLALGIEDRFHRALEGGEADRARPAFQGGLAVHLPLDERVPHADRTVGDARHRAAEELFQEFAGLPIVDEFPVLILGGKAGPDAVRDE